MSIRARTWSALALPPILWFLFEQGLSALLHADCTVGPAGFIWGLASLLGCAFAARIVWPFRKFGDALANSWLARLALASAAIFGLAIMFQILAIALVPPCVG